MADVNKIKSDIVSMVDFIAKNIASGKDVLITKNDKGAVVKILTVKKV